MGTMLLNRGWYTKTWRCIYWRRNCRWLL